MHWRVSRPNRLLRRGSSTSQCTCNAAHRTCATRRASAWPKNTPPTRLARDGTGCARGVATRGVVWNLSPKRSCTRPNSSTTTTTRRCKTCVHRCVSESASARNRIFFSPSPHLAPFTNVRASWEWRATPHCATATSPLRTD